MTIHSDIALLHPKFGRTCERLHKYLVDSYESRRTKTRFEIFETYRDPLRQQDLLRKKVSKAGPFQSAHQMGLACDFVPYLSVKEADALSEITGERQMPGWNWHSTHDYAFLRKAAELHNVRVPISWDLCHVEHPNWRAHRLAFVKLFE